MDEKKNQYTFENKEYRDTYRHSTSHVLAQAVKRLYPESKLAIGPAIEDGFYYDIDSDVTFTPEVLEKIEAEMRKICKEKLPIERFELPRAEAIKLMGEEYTSNTTMNPSAEDVANCEYFHDIQDFIAIYNALWQEVKNAK